MKEIITSRQNKQVKDACALSEKKGRIRSGLFRFDGIKLFVEALGMVKIERVFVRYPLTDGAKKAIASALDGGAIDDSAVTYVSAEVFEKLTAERSPEGIVTVAHIPTSLHMTVDGFDTSLLQGKRLLIAESLRDTGNLGTVMRSCAALGIDRLILSDDCADIYNPKTVRSAMGALFRLPTLTLPADRLPSFIGELRGQGRRVYAAALREDAERIGSLKLRSGDCFVIGNEGHGLSESVINACDRSAIIPMVEGNESLNAAAAAAICIWETVRANDE